jgi:hypothetical protein
VTVASLKSRIVDWRDLTPAPQLSVYSQSVRGRTSAAPAGKRIIYLYHTYERFTSHPISDRQIRLFFETYNSKAQTVEFRRCQDERVASRKSRTAAAGIGLLKRYPCIIVPPSDRRMLT